jgi:SAM-dependent methyltransferase
LPKTAKILDLACGAGYFLDEMKAREYTNLTGITLSADDIKLCTIKEHTVQQLDFSFLPQSAGYDDESVDFIFLRQALEHSPFPIITLIEYNRVLKQNAKMYIEVPAPDTDRNHESTVNHYSVLGPNQLASLLNKTGFDIDLFKTVEFEITEDDKSSNEKLYCVVVTKRKALDIK